jgi:tripeptide aminopeptidase
MGTYSHTQLNELIDILSTPTYFAQEDRLIQKILDKVKDKELTITQDKVGNIYIQKGLTNSQIYPCVVAHMDTVHEIREYVVLNDSNILSARLSDGTPYGIGGDDKAGVFACLQLLERIDNIKVVFFVGEEFGCYGSRLCDKSFFENVGYVIQFDAPEHNWISHISYGVKLFDSKGEFFKKIEPILKEHMGEDLRLGNHPYTDVCVIKKKVPVSCINLSIGYYNMHTVNEFVDVDVCFDCIDMGEKIIKTLGEKRYEFFEPSITHTGYDDHPERLAILETRFLEEKRKGLI